MRPGAIASDPSVIRTIKPIGRELPRHYAHPSKAYGAVWVLECTGRAVSGYQETAALPTCPRCAPVSPQSQSQPPRPPLPGSLTPTPG